MKLSFFWVGLVVFALPMLINIVYVFLPPTDAHDVSAVIPKWLELTEQTTRILYLLMLVFVVSKEELSIRSVWFDLGLLFLTLYYAVWLRYFLFGRKTELLGSPFLFVPIPLAVFPVCYFIFAALWLHNIPAVFAAAIFGAAHISVSAISLGLRGRGA